MKPAVLLTVLLSLGSQLVAEQLPKVVVLATGGTIASKRDSAKGGYEPALTGEDLVQAIPAVRTVAHVRVEQISNISSSDMTPSIWLRLSQRANELLANPNTAGLIVT